MTRYPPPPRTQADKCNDCLLFLYQARPEKVAMMTVERLCELYGVTKPALRARVGEWLGKAKEQINGESK